VVNFEEALERTYRDLLHDALVHVGPGTPDFAKRQAFARLAHFLTRSVRPDEVLVAEVLAAAIAATDHATALRFLLCGAWAAVGDEDPRVLRWFSKVADRALQRGHLAGFCVTLELVVHLSVFNGQCSEEWLAGIRAARGDASSRREVFWVGWHWQDRFHPEGGTPPPAWLVELREDERVLAAAAVVEGERVALFCPACGKAFTP